MNGQKNITLSAISVVALLLIATLISLFFKLIGRIKWKEFHKSVLTFYFPLICIVVIVNIATYIMREPKAKARNVHVNELNGTYKNQGKLLVIDRKRLVYITEDDTLFGNIILKDNLNLAICIPVQTDLDTPLWCYYSFEYEGNKKILKESLIDNAVYPARFKHSMHQNWYYQSNHIPPTEKNGYVPHIKNFDELVAHTKAYSDFPIEVLVDDSL